MSFAAYVTISGYFPEIDNYDYLDISLESPVFETYEEARRWYDMVYVQPFGTLANYIHIRHPEVTTIDAEYGVFCTSRPMDDLGWYHYEAIWW